MPNTHTHTLHLSLTAEVVRGQNHSEWVHIKAALLRCTVLQIPSRSATKSYRREKTARRKRIRFDHSY